jgi:beta-glucosidase
VSDVIFGDHNPSGRLPITFVESTDQLPPFTAYAMEGRTYRFMSAKPLFPFGFGLSFTEFRYSGLSLAPSITAGESIKVSVKVTNAGKRPGHEVVQLYLTDLESSVRVPLRQLVGFARIRLEAGEEKDVAFELTPRMLSLIDDEGRRILEPGRFRVSVGGRQPDAQGGARAGSSVLESEFDVKGKRTELPY